MLYKKIEMSNTCNFYIYNMLKKFIHIVLFAIFNIRKIHGGSLKYFYHNLHQFSSRFIELSLIKKLEKTIGYVTK